MILSLVFSVNSHVSASVFFFTPDINCKWHMTCPSVNNQGQSTIKNDRLFVSAHLSNICDYKKKGEGVNLQSLHLSEEEEEEEEEG